MSERIPAGVALARALEDRAGSRWPHRNEKDCRLEPTALPFLRPRFAISASDRAFAIGSCFARNIEEYLHRLGFHVATFGYSVPPKEWMGRRPSGILNKYTPVSIWQEIDRTARAMQASERERETILREPLVEGGGEVVDLELAGFLPVSRERALERRREIFNLYRQAFDCDVVTITLGLVEAWYDGETDRFIDQAPLPRLVKAFPDRFYLQELSYEECLSHVDRAIGILRSTGRAGKRFIVTTSPVPLMRTFTGEDALVANTRGKSILRAVAGEVARRLPNVDYFPSYEMAVLTRGADVWEDDLIHVKDDFVAKIAFHLLDAYVPSKDEFGIAERVWTLLFARWNDV
jgi:hypothetical protein